MSDNSARFNSFSMPIVCRLCRFWGDDKDKGQTFRKCMAIGHAVTAFDDDFNETLVYREDRAPVQGAYVVDGSGYYAALKTAEDFGCASFTLPKVTVTFD